MPEQSYPEAFVTLWDEVLLSALKEGQRHDSTINPIGLAETIGLEHTGSSAVIEVVASAEHHDLEPLGLLGEGGMGRVELARQRSLGREVAVKSVRPDRVRPETILALLSEARITGSLEHPGIVPVHALVNDEDGRPLFIMKRVEGYSWRQLIEDPNHTSWDGFSGERMSRHLEILLQVSHAVSFAHSRGVIHRDLKPQNVMLGEFGEVYIVDWGVACKLGAQAPGVVGTPAYMAPEMLSGEATLQTDVYLLGATLYETLTGAPPHKGASLKEILLAAFESKALTYDASTPPALREICDKAMHRDPAKRFQSVAAFREALLGFLRRRGAVELGRAAERRLTELRDLLQGNATPDNIHARKLFAECRFGFHQSLSAWPENPAATQGLQEALSLQVSFELQQKNAGAAEAILAEMPNPAPALRTALQDLRQELTEEAEAKGRLQRLEHEHDLSISSRQRALAVLLIAMGDVAVILSIELLERYGLQRYIPLVLLLSAVMFVLSTLGLIILGRKIFLVNALNRNISYVALSSFFVSFFNRLLGFLRSTPYEDTLLNDTLLVGATLVILGISTSPLLCWLGGVFFLIALIGAFSPGYVSLLLGASVIVVFSLVAILWSGLAVKADEAQGS